MGAATISSNTCTLNTAVAGGLCIVETEDDNVVTDITPSTLSWATMKGSESSATVTNVLLPNITRVMGADEVPVLRFEVEADESSSLLIDEAKVYLTANGVAASNVQIDDVKLYRGTKLLDSL